MGFGADIGISWTICKHSAPRFRQITTPTPHQSIFTGRVLLRPSNSVKGLKAMPLSTKQYNLVVGTGQGAAGKVTVGLASHWPCITDFSGLSAYRLTAMSGVPTLLVGYGIVS